MKTSLVKTKNPKKIPKILREKSKEIRELTPDILDLIKEMIKVMNENNGVGLSAIQIGIPLRVMIIKNGEEDFAFINPEIISLSEKEVPFREGCLSFPGMYANIIRPETAKIRVKDIDWQDVEIEADGIVGRAFQHEIDHMNGIVFVDHVENFDDLERVNN